MGPKAVALFFLPLLVVSAVAYDVTKILADYPEFSTMSKYLTDTKLVDDINRQGTVTVLVVDDSAISPLASLSADVLKKVLAVHIILDYYDPYKLTSLPDKTAIATTLLQTTGKSTGQIGFLNVTQTGKEDVAFGSAVSGAPLSSDLIKVVAAKPYNFSVLQVSSPIVPPNIESATTAPPPQPAAATPKAAPVEAPKASSPVANAPEASDNDAVPTASVEAPEASSDATDAASPAEGNAKSAAIPRAVMGTGFGLVMAILAYVAIYDSKYI